MSRWYRAYEGTVTDAKLAEAAAIADVSRAVSIAAWHCLLESATAVNNCGSYETNPRRVSLILCEPPAAVEALFAAYSEIGLIGEGVILSWKKRQHESDSSTERTRKWREKKAHENAKSDGGDGCETSRDAPETETDTDISSNEDLSSGDDRPLTKNEVLGAWQDRLVPLGFPAVRKMTPARDRQLKARLRDCSMDEWLAAFAALERSKFCQGHNDREWWADLDFLLQPKSFTKLIEGAYDR